MSSFAKALSVLLTWSVFLAGTFFSWAFVVCVQSQPVRRSSGRRLDRWFMSVARFRGCLLVGRLWWFVFVLIVVFLVLVTVAILMLRRR